MIFLTVGSQLPFGRLVRAVDRWCAETGHTDVFGQIGAVDSADYRPSAFEWQKFLTQERCDQRFDEADLIVAHAGMGSIISALSLGKPIVVMPRRAALGEHRNDHQLATVARLRDRAGIHVAMNESELASILSSATQGALASRLERLKEFADETLINHLRDFIHGVADEPVSQTTRSLFFPLLQPARRR